MRPRPSCGPRASAHPASVPQPRPPPPAGAAGADKDLPPHLESPAVTIAVAKKEGTNGVTVANAILDGTDAIIHVTVPMEETAVFTILTGPSWGSLEARVVMVKEPVRATPQTPWRRRAARLGSSMKRTVHSMNSPSSLRRCR